MASKPEQRVVIVGNGMVSHGLCDALVARDGRRNLRVTVLGEEAYPAYDRVQLSACTGREPSLLASREWYQQRGIDLRLGQPVTAIDCQDRSVQLADGGRVAYDSLVLATGAAARVPGCAGLDDPRVFTYRNFDDVLRIRAAAGNARSAAVVGGGLLGLEAAKLLLDAGLAVTVVESSRQLMPRQLDADSAELLQARVRELGVELRLATQLSEIRGSDADLSLSFADGTALTVDLIVIAIGVVPRDELAREAGLAVGARGGILVDDELRSSDPHVYALGDCASHRGRSYGMIGPGLAMAQVLASNLQGKRAHFRRADLSCELKLLGIPVSAVGDYDRDARVVCSVMPEGRRNLLLESGRLVGATAVGGWSELARVRLLAERKGSLSRRRIAHFMQTGLLFPDADPSAASWPDSAIVCNCRRVPKRDILAVLPTCDGRLETLCRSSGAGTVCGACRAHVAELLGVSAPPVAGQRPRLLIGISIVVAALCALWLAAPELPAIDSVRSPLRRFDELRVGRDYRRLTGFVLTGLAALSLLLSLRKRTALLKVVSFGSARAMHALLGALALVGLIAHTGLETGANLSFALMTCFVGAALVGGAAGAAAGLEASVNPVLSGPARRARRPLSLLHLLWLWPLPVLLGAHVFAAYYF